MALGSPSTKELAQRLLQLSESIAKLNQRLLQSKKGSNEYKETLRQISIQQKEASATSEELAQKQARLSSKVDNHKSSIRQANDAQKQWNRTLKETNTIVEQGGKGGGAQGFFGAFTSDKILSTIGTVTKFLGVYALISGVAKVVNTALFESTKRFIEFDKSLANLAAVGGQEAANSIEIFKNQAIEVANETKFTAVQVVGLQTELSKLGFSAQEVVAATASVAKSAQALGAPLDQTALVIGQTIRAFDLLAEEATYVGDTIVTAINNSALSFQSFQTAIQYVGPIAQSAGLTLSETAAAMGVLADAGFRASRIGTGLRGVISGLTENGEDLIPVLRELRNQNISFSEAVELVGKTSAAQLITLTRNIDELEKAKDAYTEFGAAARASATQLDSIDGALSLLNSSFDTFLTKLGESITKTTGFKNVVTSLVRFFSDEAAQELVTASLVVSTSTQEIFNTIAQGAQGALGDANQYFKEVFKLTEDESNQLFSLLSKSGSTFGESIKAIETDNKGFLYGIKDAGIAQVSLFQKIVDGSGGAIISLDDLGDAYRGVNNAIKNTREEQKKLDEIEKGRQLSVGEYGKSIDELQEKKNKGLDVDRKQVDIIANKLLDANEKLNREIETSTDLTAEQTLQKKGQIQQNNLYLSQLGRIGSVSKDVEATAKKELEDRFKVELKLLKEAIEARKENLAQKQEALQRELEVAKAQKNQQRILEIQSQLINDEADAFSDLSIMIGNFNSKWKDTVTLVNGSPVSIDSDTLNQSVDSLLDSISNLDISDRDIIGLLKTIRQSVSGVIGDYGTEDAKKFAEDTLKKLIDFLKQKGFSQQQIDDYVAIYTNTIFPPIDDAMVAQRDKELKDKDKEREEYLKQRNAVIAQIIQDSISTTADIYKEQRDAEFENLTNQLEAEKDKVKERSEFEQDVLKSQLESQLISQEEYAARLEQIKKKEIQRQNSIDKKIFEQEKKKDTSDANVRYLEALANIIPALITEDNEANPVLLAIKYAASSLLATAAWQSSVAAINKRQFFPKRFAEGGIVEGPSHAEGGIPFTVKGVGGYEMEGGEYIVNKRSAAKYKGLLDQINESRQTPKYKFATGGIVGVIENSEVKQVELLEAIAEATTGTAINTGRPVRAFVSSSDLKNDTNARRIKDRNSNI